MRQIIFFFSLLILTQSCVKVEEQPAFIKLGEPYADLLSINNCYISDTEPYYSWYNLVFPIEEIENILLESVELSNPEWDGPVVFESFTIDNNEIVIEDICYLFEGEAQISNTITIKGTNGVGEKIKNMVVDLVISRPPGAN